MSEATGPAKIEAKPEPKPLKKFVPKKAPAAGKVVVATAANTVKYEAAPEDTLTPSAQPFQGKAVAAATEVAAKPAVAAKQVVVAAAKPAVVAKPAVAPAVVAPAVVAPAAPVDVSSEKRINQLFTDVKDPRAEVYKDFRDAFVEKVEDDPLLKTYMEKQHSFETSKHYDHEQRNYMPSTRKAFYKFIDDTYAARFGLPPAIKDKELDPKACETLIASGKSRVEPFLYQRFIKEYIRESAPYRGLLVYHGLGSGKTCSAIAAAEALYGVSNKKIIVMTPKSIRGNFINEISFCGFRHFSLQNHWVKLPLLKKVRHKDPVTGRPRIKVDNLILNEMYGRSVLSLSSQYLQRLKQPAVDILDPSVNAYLWIPDFDKPPTEANFDTLTTEEQDLVKQQINETINNRIEFISYNGITSAKLKEIACEDPTHFDNAVIVIDEIHNLGRLMEGTIVPYLVPRSEKRKLKLEVVEPGRWVPALCNKSNRNYKRAYLMYRLLAGAKNSKIIGLSGTPVVNFPEEFGILANLLGGYIDCIKMTINTAEKGPVDRFQAIAERDPRVDFVRIDKGDAYSTALLSLFNEGYIKVLDPVTKTFLGVRRSDEADAQEGVKPVFERIKAAAVSAGIPITLPPTYLSKERLPINPEVFRSQFIEEDYSDIRKENIFVLKKRLAGLISYYKGAKPEFVPSIGKDELIKCPMSNYVFPIYCFTREKEIESSEKADKTGKIDRIYTFVETLKELENASHYNFRTRALCNFTFPKKFKRPFPNSGILMDAELGNVNGDALEVIDEGVDYNEVAERSDEKEDAEAAVTIALEEAQTDAADAAEVAAVAGEAGAEAAGEAAEVVAAAEVAVEGEETKKVLIKYNQQLAMLMKTLDSERDEYLKLDAATATGALKTYSPKLHEILTRMKDAEGPVMVYSQFFTVEGLGVLGIALKANGYEEIKFTGKWWGNEPEFTEESLKSIKKGPNSGIKRFITFSGEGTAVQRAVALNLFNGFWGKLPGGVRKLFEDGGFDLKKKYTHGEVCACIGITSAGAEGLSLRNVRQVHIMEPYWNMIRIEQVKGRAVRICSHMDLPVAERKVDIFTYVTVFSSTQKNTPYHQGGIPKMILTSDTVAPTPEEIAEGIERVEIPTTDEMILNVSMRKDKINKRMLEVLKEVAIDCKMNQPDNELLDCFNPGVGTTNPYMFDPDLERDTTTTISEYGKGKAQKTVTLGTMLVTKVALKTPGAEVKEYLLGPEDPVTKQVKFYEATDRTFRAPQGTINILPKSAANPSGYGAVKFYNEAERLAAAKAAK
jgi:hypothetical protein